ncbi:MAG: DUF5683 domain-containing protein [Candidatus Latescibacteria bacterium]|nr:DUF5683 domain-containing protein [Candidatus Latescibacterota bacterium]
MKLVSMAFCLAVSFSGTLAQTTSADSLFAWPDSLPTPAQAFWRSAAIPGWGQFVNGRPLKGVVYLSIHASSVAMAIRNRNRAVVGGGNPWYAGQAWRRGRNNWLIFGGLSYILCILDAYVDAHMATFDVTPVATITPSGATVLAFRVGVRR